MVDWRVCPVCGIVDRPDTDQADRHIPRTVLDLLSPIWGFRGGCRIVHGIRGIKVSPLCESVTSNGATLNWRDVTSGVNVGQVGIGI